MADEGIKIEGLAELQAKLDDLGTKAAERAIRNALRAGAAIEQAAITERAPIKVGSGGILPDGALKSDFTVTIKKDSNGGMAAIVGPGKYTAHVARWVEYGHRIVTGGYSKVLKSGKVRGPGKVHAESVPEHPFIRPAWEATRDEVTQTVAKTLVAEVEKAASKKGTT
jgi:HK97 gp10 family phage protein